MRFQRWIAGALTLSLFGCGGPVPSGIFLTLSVSTRDVAVETSINGKANEFLSGGKEGQMTSSAPINKLVHEGENTASFVLTPSAYAEARELSPAILTTLEIVAKGEMVDTLAPGDRTYFSRELSEEEEAALIAGEIVTITQTFTIDPEKLQALKDDGER